MPLIENIITDFFTLSSDDISNKYVTLSRTPVTGSEVALNIVKGSPQIYGVDYYVDGKLLKWDGMILDGKLIAGDEIRAVYSTDGRLNVFSNPPARDGVEVISTINTEALMEYISGDSPYFDQLIKVSRVDVIYEHEDDRQKKEIIHIGSNLQGNISWSVEARSGTWLKSQVRVRDQDGAIHIVSRDTIGTDEDLVLS